MSCNTSDIACFAWIRILDKIYDRFHRDSIENLETKGIMQNWNSSERKILKDSYRTIWSCMHCSRCSCFSKPMIFCGTKGFGPKKAGLGLQANTFPLNQAEHGSSQVVYCHLLPATHCLNCLSCCREPDWTWFGRTNASISSSLPSVSPTITWHFLLKLENWYFFMFQPWRSGSAQTRWTGQSPGVKLISKESKSHNTIWLS